jgi:REP element-mobilizing transposase RayT
MNRFQNKYRIPSARASWWNYRNAGSYFITICTQNREKCFGEITDGKMILSEIGIIAETMWREIKNHTTTIETDAFVIMPNHIHGIVMLNNDQNDVGTCPVESSQIIKPKNEHLTGFKNLLGVELVRYYISSILSSGTTYSNRALLKIRI